MHLQGRWQLPEGEAGSQEGRAGRAAEGVHQRVAEAEEQGGGGAAAAQGEADQEVGVVLCSAPSLQDTILC